MRTYVLAFAKKDEYSTHLLRERNSWREAWLVIFYRCHANKTNIVLYFKIWIFTSPCVTFLELPHTAECSKYKQQFCVVSLKVGNAVIKREDNSIRRKNKRKLRLFPVKMTLCIHAIMQLLVQHRAWRGKKFQKFHAVDWFSNFSLSSLLTPWGTRYTLLDSVAQKYMVE